MTATQTPTAEVISQEMGKSETDINDLRQQIEELLQSSRQSPVGMCHKSLNKTLAEAYIESGEETNGIYHLTESHGVSLRMRAMMSRKSSNGTTEDRINRKYLSFQGEYAVSPEGMFKRLEELPTEWTIVQITCGFRASDRFRLPNQHLPMPDVYLTRFPTRVEGGIVDEPYCKRITYNVAQDKAMVTPLEEIHLIVQENKIKPKSLYNDVKKYWEVRDAIGKRIENVMQEVEMSWIGAWRFLLLGRLLDCSLKNKINSFVDELLANNMHSLSRRSKRMFCRVVEASQILKSQEIHKVLTELVGSKTDAEKLTKTIIGKFPELKTAQRQTVMLILDELMEIVPWESMNVLQDHPVARNECLQMLHALYKAHEDSMECGFKLLTDPCGKFVVNADGNLQDMEERMKNFLPKRLPTWVGTYGKKEQEYFKSGLTNHDIFLYSGHGNGRQIMGSVLVEQLCVQAVCMLMGCSSANFSSYGGRTELHGMSQSYHIGASPTILGNLWEVSDFDTDRITVALLHSWIPLRKSMKRDISFYLEDRKRNDFKYCHEPELLRALVIGRKAAVYSMTRFAFIARGLPVKIVQTK